MFETMEEVVKAGDQHVRDDYLRMVLDIAADAIERHPANPDKVEEHIKEKVGLIVFSGFDHMLRRIVRSSGNLSAWKPSASTDPNDWFPDLCQAAMLADIGAEIERLRRHR
jgi:hypothetical protein